MPANITYPTLSSETVLWQTRADAVGFFNNITIPDATVSAKGAVNKMAALSYTNFTAYDSNDFVNLNIDGNDETLPAYATFIEVRTKLQALSSSYNSLLTKLRNAGILDS